MAYRVKKTEHAGAKNARGFWGPKSEAKHQSSRVRRREATRAAAIELNKMNPRGMGQRDDLE